MPNAFDSRAILLGRILLVALFLFSGVMKLMDVSGTAAHIQSKGLPAPAVLAVAAGLLEVVAGLMVVVGWRTRLAVLVLAAFTTLASVLFHDFWNHAGREQINQLLHAFKNVAMIGGLIILYGAGPGTKSVDARGTE